MNTKRNFSFLYIYKKKTLRKNSFKLNCIFWNKQLRPALTILRFVLNQIWDENEDLGLSYFKSSFKSSSHLISRKESLLRWPWHSSEDAWVAKVPRPQFHFSTPCQCRSVRLPPTGNRSPNPSASPGIFKPQKNRPPASSGQFPL